MTAGAPPSLPLAAITTDPASTARLAAPSLKRRLACFVYEGVLLFGVVMATGLVYGVAIGQRDAMLGRQGLQVILFVALAAYFTWFWSHGGQTLAMKTWHIRVVGADGAAVSAARSALRYLLSWLWFVPALLSLWLAGIRGAAAITLTLAFGVVAYALLARLHPDRQFWHDVVCGTRLVDVRPPASAPATGR